MRWWRDEADARNRVACLGDDLVDLEARQLSALTRLGTLCHLDLYFLGIDEVFGCHAETSRSHLLGFAGEADAILSRMESLVVLASLTRVAACTEGVHGQSHCLVGFL